MTLAKVLPCTLAACLAAGAAFSQPISTDAVLKKARADSYVVRTGKWELAAPMAAALEAQSKIDPDNAVLWTRLSSAYFLRAAAAINPGGNPGDPQPDFQKGKAAADRAILLDPKLAEAYAMRGVSTVIVASMGGSMADMPKGIADLNRGVELDPKAIVPRLQRAFTGVNLPKGIRDDKAAEEDLNFLIRVSATRRESDRLHMMLGDVFFEGGKTTEAKAQYDIAAAPGTTAPADSGFRLAALARNQLPTAEIASLRAKTGQDCASCHGQ